MSSFVSACNNATTHEDKKTTLQEVHHYDFVGQFLKIS
jgi:hypothetical protein